MASCGDNFKQFKIVVDSPRQATSYGDMRQDVYDNWRHVPSFVRDEASS